METSTLPDYDLSFMEDWRLFRQTAKRLVRLHRKSLRELKVNIGKHEFFDSLISWHRSCLYLSGLCQWSALYASVCGESLELRDILFGLCQHAESIRMKRDPEALWNDLDDAVRWSRRLDREVYQTVRDMDQHRGYDQINVTALRQWREITIALRSITVPSYGLFELPQWDTLTLTDEQQNTIYADGESLLEVELHPLALVASARLSRASNELIETSQPWAGYFVARTQTQWKLSQNCEFIKTMLERNLSNAQDRTKNLVATA